MFRRQSRDLKKLFGTQSRDLKKLFGTEGKNKPNECLIKHFKMCSINLSYEGNPKQFKDWIKSFKMCAYLTQCQAHREGLQAGGGVSDFIQRCLTNAPDGSGMRCKRRCLRDSRR